MDEKPLLQLCLPPRPAAVPTGRRAVRALECLVGPDTAERFELCVSELVGNSVRHGDLNADDRIAVLVRESEHGLRLEVSDSGCGFVPPEETPTPDVERHAPTGGYGLFLVETLSDEWGIEVEDGTRVWVETHEDG